MKNLLPLIVVLITHTVLTSQVEYSSYKDSDAEATLILNKIYDSIAETGDYKVEFTINVEFPGYQPEVQKGTLVQSGSNYLFNSGDQAIYAFNDTIWTHHISQKEVYIDERDLSAGDENLGLSPIQLLGTYKSEDFVYAILNTEPFESSTRYFIEFKPLLENPDYSKIRVDIVDGTVPTLESIVVFNKDGSRYSINLDSIDTQIGIEDREFQFDITKYPGIHVEDIRL